MEHASAKSTTKPERKTLKLPFKALLIGGAIGTALFFVLLAVFAAILPPMGVRVSWLPYIAVFSGGLSAFLASYFAAKGVGANGMLLGFGCALIEMLIIGIVLLIAVGSVGAVTAFLCAALLGCGGGGGVFGVNAARRNS